MIRLTEIVIILLFFCKNIVGNPIEEAENRTEEFQLVFAHVLFRHGDRNIFQTYPKDPLKEKIGSVGGSLTKVGKQEQYELGKYLRRRYMDLIGTQYSSENVYIQSSDTERSIMSALCNAAGMFPPTGDEVWNEHLHWQPIPIHVIEQSDDYILQNSRPCARYDKLASKYTKSTQFKYQMEKNADFIEYLKANTGRALPDSKQVMYLIVVLVDEKDKGYELPRWVDGISLYTNDTLEQIAALHMEALTHTNELKKYRAGFLLKEILDRFKDKSLSQLQPDRSIWLYSAHDLTIIHILNALNLYELHLPPFASSVFFELYQRSGEYFVQLFYRKTPTEYVPPLVIPNCGTMCPLDKFIEVYVHILPTDDEDYDTLCHLAS